MAVEAIATVGALIFLGFGLSRLRKEIAARKVEGLRYAREQLESQQFRNSHRTIIDLWEIGGNEYPEGVNIYLRDVLATIDFVAKLIELDYVDEDLLFYLFANVLMELDLAITDFDRMDNSKIPLHRARFPRGFALLKEASKVSDDEAIEIFERLFVDKAT
jgi:hypothetical protein